MFAHFQVSGTIPEDKDRLNRSAIGSASSLENYLKRRGGILSGPIAL